ncbi:hypothetical protein [Clavibacter michiganensis]|uniref:DUF1345 domain-containing protein n=2 Tax=Clavibacter michiganensis subsp. insidiosus TaxID=33014 RepID=A0A0D5CI59_9MICO|nr:hypothetical protein [Clavibacter michiganensis]AJW78952.1 hypothetical protein VO01_07255 [Clavibacter michiganensis subsp. insidiosus]AWF98365.1 hypothetical protein BEH61_07585 [Clavibacter michiganensis subsp. insidiosus]AWG01434.1 hypothetical protein BEH62_07490 [Clavibacter michiganensis subsp. insidiosus]OQJ60031.1 hypothetical protein B5P21_08990 [Clavibacter michiganensis subsp. insidiosus]RII87913.1 hypothetical protein DZF92_05075 [Clavibacter michiganensis subsp. insidiosus]
MPIHPSRRTVAEPRWPAAVGLLVAVALYGIAPTAVPSGVRVAVVAIAGALLVPLVALNPRRFVRETPWSRGLGLALGGLLVVANQVSLVVLVIALVDASEAGPELLLTALQVWGTNVLAFALVFWELDRGGPVARRTHARASLAPADFRFPQDEDADAVSEVARRSSEHADWVPGFVDYAYFSLTNSMAYSPTDVMPLSHRAKALMALEAFAGFVILALVIARAVNILS